MKEQELLNFLKSNGISNVFTSIVEEPKFSKQQLRNFEIKYRISTKDFLAMKKEDLIANYGMDRETIIDWKIAEDNANFYSLQNKKRKGETNYE